LKKVKVLIAGEQALIREGLSKILSNQETIEVVGETGNSVQAMDLAIKLKPDVVLIDIDTHERKNIETARTMKSRMPETRIIVLTINDQEDSLFELIKAGVSAYVLKDISPGFLIQTILGVARGESFIHSVMTSKMFSEFNRLTSFPRSNNNPYGLTKREFDVLRLVARGDNNRSIAQILFISEKTVKNHLTNIFQKLGVDDRTQAAIHAVKNKMVDL